jgi:hypothetical protein
MPNNRDIKNPWKGNYEQSKAQERMDKERDIYDKKQANKELRYLFDDSKDQKEGYDDEVWLG